MRLVARVLYLLLFALCASASQAGTTSYTYDALGRLVSESYNCGASVSYSYDAAGNRTATSATTSGVCPPTAVDDYVTTAYNTPATFDPRVNDSDPNGYPLTITGTGTASHGSVAINGGTSLTYTPNNGFSGADSFSYTISNGHGGTASATVHMTVQSQPIQPPVANDDYVSTPLNTAATFDPRVNDSDPQGLPLTITGTGTPSHGSVVNNSGTSLTYTPSTGFTGSDSFSYTISNGHSTASATVHMTVTLPQPQAPDANLTFTRPPISATIDPRYYSYPGETLTITGVGTPGHGTATIGGGGTYITYTATGGFSGQTTFTYTVTDGYGQTATGTVYVTVNTQ